MTIFPSIYLTAHCLIFGFCPTHAPDPCINYQPIQNQEKRSVNYSTNIENDFVINDVHMDGNVWYRPITRIGTNMPTFAPDMFKCCTVNPIWLNGNLPTVDDGVVTRHVCTRTFTNKCEKSWDISVKNCPEGFYVYLLKAAQLEDSAYCFGSGGVPCPEGQSSLTGYVPDCVDSGFPNTTLSPEVSSTLHLKYDENGDRTNALQPVFLCNLGNDYERSYYYDVHWFINGHFVFHFENILGSVSNKKSALLPEHWTGTHHMNMLVSCSVRMRFGKDEFPSPFYASSSFEAGVFPTEFQHQVIEGKNTTIIYNVTVPVGCHDYNQMAGCEHILYITQPNYQFNQLECSKNNIEQQDLAFDNMQNCGLVIRSDNANKVITFQTTGYIDGKYNSDIRTTKIRLKSQSRNVSDRSGAWNAMSIPEIEVHVSDADAQMSNRGCTAFNDPHFYTFDNKYYDFYGLGMYVLYRHKTRPYEVQVVFASCNNHASCHCAIAIRSGKSLLSIITKACGELYKENGANRRSIGESAKVNNKICNNKHLIIETNGSKYTATFPIGTQVTFEVETRFIKYVNIKPSVLDISETEGLCGLVSKNNKDTTDDFTKRNGVIVTNSLEFAKSWKVPDIDSLFVKDPILTEETYHLGSYCECLTESQSDISDHSNLICNLSQPMQSCHNQETDDIYKNDCSGSKHRRRRDTSGIFTESDDIDDDYEGLIIDPSVYDITIDPESFTWINGWTYDKAKESCTTFFTDRFSEEISEASGVKIVDYIDSCIADIKITGNTEYMASTLSTMQTLALSEIKMNETLAKETNEEGITVFAKLSRQLCEKNCSNNGVCVNGICVCNEKYGELDCSVLKSAAPTDTRIPADGLCRTRSRPCKSTNIYGRFSSDTVSCKMRHYQINENGIQYTSEPIILNAKVFSAFKVSCEIASQRKRRSAEVGLILADGYEISVSNDGQNFSESMSLIIYDDLCYSCNSSTSTCEKISTCPSSTATESKDQTTIKVAIIISVVAVKCIIILAVLSCKWKNNLKKKTGQTDPNMVDGYNAKNIPPEYVVFSMPSRPSTATSINGFAFDGERKTPDHLFLAKTD